MNQIEMSRSEGENNLDYLFDTKIDIEHRNIMMKNNINVWIKQCSETEDDKERIKLNNKIAIGLFWIRVGCDDGIIFKDKDNINTNTFVCYYSKKYNRYEFSWQTLINFGICIESCLALKKKLEMSSSLLFLEDLMMIADKLISKNCKDEAWAIHDILNCTFSDTIKKTSNYLKNVYRSHMRLLEYTYFFDKGKEEKKYPYIRDVLINEGYTQSDIKINRKHRPDLVLEKDGNLYVVEVKNDNFTGSSKTQLKRYVDFYKAYKGIAIGKKLTCELDNNMTFYNLDRFIDREKKYYELHQ